MPYCTRQNLIDRFGVAELIQLTDRGAVGLIDDLVLNQAIADASAEIDTYLAGRYDVALVDVPVVLVRTACQLTRFYLYDEVVPELVQNRYDNAVRLLDKIGTGQLTLGLDSAGAEATRPQSPEMQSAGGVFGRKDDW